MNNRRRVLGVDPGLARLGWAVLEVDGHDVTLVGCGGLETSAKEALPNRLLLLHKRLGDILREYRPLLVAAEKLFFTKNVTTGIAVAQARGAVLLAAAEHQLPFIEFTPTEVKSIVTGDGRADKRQVQRMIQILLKLKQLPKHDDTADAIAIALCAASRKVLH